MSDTWLCPLTHHILSTKPLSKNPWEKYLTDHISIPEPITRAVEYDVLTGLNLGHPLHPKSGVVSLTRTTWAKSWKQNGSSEGNLKVKSAEVEWRNQKEQMSITPSLDSCARTLGFLRRILTALGSPPWSQIRESKLSSSLKRSSPKQNCTTLGFPPGSRCSPLQLVTSVNLSGLLACTQTSQVHRCISISKSVT